MKKQVWKSGPPPSVGWWPASVAGDPDALRWWNGSFWSHVAWPHSDAKEAAKIAKIPAFCSGGVEWLHRPASWPARSKT